MEQETLKIVDAACQNLSMAAILVKQDVDKVVADRQVVPVVRHFDQLRYITARIKEARESLANIEDSLSRDVIPSIMRDSGVKTITVDGVGRVTVSYRYSCTMLDKDKCLDWLDNNGHGDLIQLTVNSQTLSAFSKSMLEDDGIELPAEIFKTSTSPFTSITKTR